MRKKLPPLPDLLRLLFSQSPVIDKSVNPKDCLLPLSAFGDYWTLKDAFQGTLILGGTGSGKTSGSGSKIQESFLKYGMGGLVLTVKPEETNYWKERAKQFGREKDLLIFSPQSDYLFNFLHYEQSRPGDGAGLTHNIVKLFLTVMEIGAKRNSKSSEDYWTNTLRELLRNTIDLLQLAEIPVSVRAMHSIISSAPDDLNKALSPEWVKTSFCGQVLARAQELNSNNEDWGITSEYWLQNFPTWAEKTRSIVVSSFNSCADSFLTGKMRRLFCTETNITPEECWKSSKIIVLDINLKEYDFVGQQAQVLFKYIFQKAVERRDIRKYPTPVFLWADEAQNFISAYDSLFASTARSSRVATVMLSQNIPGLYSAAGGESGRHEIDGLLGNLTTKIFHAQSDIVTNKFAADLISKSKQMKPGFSRSNDEKGNNRMNINFSEITDYQVSPIEFHSLRTGGEENNGVVQAIMFQSGRVWKSNGKNFIKIKFRQTGF